MATTLDKAPTEQAEAWRQGKATKIRWTNDEQIQVLAGAARLLLKSPNTPHLEAVRLGQQCLPGPRRREIPSITPPSWAWFRDALPLALQWAIDHPEDDPIPEGPARPEALPQAARPEPPPESEPVRPEPAPEPTPGITDLLDALARSRNDQLALLARVDRLEVALVGALGRLESLLRGGFTLVPAGAAVAPVRAPEEAPRSPVLAPPPPVAPPAPPAPQAPPVTRKPRVVVLSVSSGHARNGIKEGTKGHVERLELWDTPHKHVDFSPFDYVVTTKWTPVEWSNSVKLGNKLRHAHGNAESITKYVRSLPEVPRSGSNA